MKKLIALSLFLIFGFIAFTVNLKNPQTVTFDYYFNIHWETQLMLLLSIAFVLGLLLGALMMSFKLFASKREIGKTKRSLAKVEKEVENLRAMPMKDEL